MTKGHMLDIFTHSKSLIIVLCILFFLWFFLNMYLITTWPFLRLHVYSFLEKVPIYMRWLFTSMNDKRVLIPPKQLKIMSYLYSYLNLHIYMKKFPFRQLLGHQGFGVCTRFNQKCIANVSDLLNNIYLQCWTVW